MFQSVLWGYTGYRQADVYRRLVGFFFVSCVGVWVYREGFFTRQMLAGSSTSTVNIRMTCLKTAR